MPPLVIPTLVKFALGSLGAAAIVHWAVREARRMKMELARARAAVEPIRREALPTLKRDPRTDEWRVM